MVLASFEPWLLLLLLLVWLVMAVRFLRVPRGGLLVIGVVTGIVGVAITEGRDAPRGIALAVVGAALIIAGSILMSRPRAAPREPDGPGDHHS